MDLGRLVDLREDNDLIQKELGNALGCSNHAISTWEKEEQKLENNMVYHKENLLKY